MMKKIFLLLVAMATLIAAGLTHAAPQVTVHTDHYTIDGDTAAALRQSLNARSPVRQNNQRYDAYTAWQVRWHYRFDDTGSSCGLQEVATTVEVRFTLPDWPSRAMAPPRLQDHWDAYHGALLEHENGHLQFAIEAAGEIELALAAMAPRSSCQAMDRAAAGVAKRLMGKYLALEKQYDLDTNHGMATGAVFP